MRMITSTNGDRMAPKGAGNQSSQVDPLYDLFSSGHCEPLQSSPASNDVSLLWKLSHHIGSQQLDHIFSSPLSDALNYLRDVSTCVENYIKNVFSAYNSASDFSRAITSDKASLVAEEVARNDSLKLAAIDKKLDAILDAITASKLEIINSMQYSHIKPIISYLETLKGYFKAELQYIHVTGYERIQRLEGDHEEMNYLQESRLPKPGTLYTLLNDVINQEMAIPKHADDSVAIMVLDLLVTSTETYFLTANFLLNYYRQVAIAFYHLNDTDQFNKYYSMGIDNFNDFLTENQLGLIAKVERTLDEVEATGFQGTAPEFKRFFANSRKQLVGLRENLKSTAALLPNELPKRITEKLDFSKSPLSTPTGQWIDYRKVSYAIQYLNESNGISGMTVISKWTTPWTILGRATPMVGIPKDIHGRTRIVFRRFDNDKPEMTAIITDPTMTSFRDIDRELFNAAMEPNEELAAKEIEKYLKLQANVNAVFEKGRGPMHMAAQNGNVALVKKLKLKKAKVDIKDYNGYTPFHNAAFKRQVKFCEEILKSGLIPANILAANRFTPLHSAVMSGGDDVVRVFTHHRETNLEAQSDRGLTALHLAALNGFSSIVSILLDAKVLVNCRSYDGLTALDMAIKNKKKAVIDILLARTEINVNLKDYRAKLSPLHHAALTDQQTVTQQLIAKGAYIDTISWEGRTPLHIAIQYNRTAIVDVLLNSGANFNAPAGAWSPLQLAIIYNNENAVFKLLKNRSIDVNFQEARTRFSALHLAAKYNQAEVANELVRRGAQVELMAEQSKTPLHVAAIANSVKVMELLLRSGVDFNAKTADGVTSLEICRKLKNGECEDLLEGWIEDRTIDMKHRRRSKLGIANSAASKPASVINDLIASIQNTFHCLTFGTFTRFQNLQLQNTVAFNLFLPSLSTDKKYISPDYSATPHLDINGSLLLLELLSRKLTHHKIINNSELQMNDFEARAIALNLTFSKEKSSFESYRITYWQLMNGYLQAQKEF